MMSFSLTKLIVNPESLPKNDLGFSHNDILNTWAMKSIDFKAKKELELNWVLFNKVLRSMSTEKEPKPGERHHKPSVHQNSVRHPSSK
jgi:hypothetical protein